MVKTVILVAMMMLVAAWEIGRFHISRVDASEVGKLTSEEFKQRLIVYGAPLGALFGVLGTFDSVVDQLSMSNRLWFLVLVSLSGMFALVIFTASYLEAFWYRSPMLSRARRRKVFEVVCLPVLYSSLYLYWLPLIAAWLLFISGALTKYS